MEIDRMINHAQLVVKQDYRPLVDQYLRLLRQVLARPFEARLGRHEALQKLTRPVQPLVAFF